MDMCSKDLETFHLAAAQAFAKRYALARSGPLQVLELHDLQCRGQALLSRLKINQSGAGFWGQFLGRINPQDVCVRGFQFVSNYPIWRRSSGHSSINPPLLLTNNLWSCWWPFCSYMMDCVVDVNCEGCCRRFLRSGWTLFASDSNPSQSSRPVMRRYNFDPSNCPRWMVFRQMETSTARSTYLVVVVLFLEMFII